MQSVTPAHVVESPERSVHDAVNTYLHVRREGGACVVTGQAECWRGDSLDSGGIYAGWRWDGSRLVVRNDRYGMFPLFYAVEPDGIRLSHSLVRLLSAGVSRALDDDAIAVFLGMGWYIGEDTPFAAIRAVPPAASFEWTPDGLRVTGSYATGKPVERDWDDAVDEYIELFARSMQRHCERHDNLIVPISGGKDSRHILLQLLKGGRRPELTVTFHQLPWQSSNFDVGIAVELAAATGVRHIVLEQPPNALGVERRKNVLTHFCSDEHAHYVVLADHLRGRAGALVDGIAGDVLSESKSRSVERLEMYEDGRYRDIARLELGAIPYMRRVLSPEAFQRFHPDRALVRLEAEVARHASAPNPFGSLRFWNRTRREIGVSPFGILADRPVVAPYLDHDLFDFFASLPARFVLQDRRLHTAAMRRAFPEHADIPFDYERDRIPNEKRISYARANTMSRFQKHIRSVAWMTSAVGYAARTGSNLLNRKYVAFRSARSLVRNIERDEAAPWLARTAVYLAQLNAVVEDGPGAALK